tara:strand:- start:20556 stop:21656 length:1101 start_codon:yes stop_codon:yes gene_type:complete
MLNKIHIISDLATPHNNALVLELRKFSNYKILNWYRFKYMRALPWDEPLGTDKDDFYFNKFSNLFKILSIALFNRKDKFILIGYSNFLTRFLIIFFLLTRRNFSIWFDHPNEQYGLKNVIRSLSYFILQLANPTFFVVGKHTKIFFKQCGFEEKNLINLPIFIDVPSNSELENIDKELIKKNFNIDSSKILITAASRIEPEKSYDTLIDAIINLNDKIKKNILVLIIGDGSQKKMLIEKVEKNKINKIIIFKKWLSPKSYKNIIAVSDIFIHPAKFDAFGGGPLFAMSHGIPVIGSDGSGVVIERINHSINGYKFKAGDDICLSKLVENLIVDKYHREIIGKNARFTALKWKPSVGAKIIISALFN